MARADSPADDSPLSDMDTSEDEFADDATEVVDEVPPPKRQKLSGGGAASVASSAVHHEVETAEPDELDGMSDVSSDTDGDIPSSPINARQEDDDFQEQVTQCAWEGCRAGEMDNMDRLVEHIHNDHIESRQKKYTCEWVGCPRKSMPHASGYALKAHMRSHTREKPFYCYLPECDRAFTRSDALAKHMRTVHETEALRPSDPVPKSMQAGGGPAGKSKLKIIIKTPQSHAGGHDDTLDDTGNHAGDDSGLGGSAHSGSGGDAFTPLTEEQGFTPEELQMPLKRLFGLCKLQVRWAQEEGEELTAQWKKWEALYKREWLEKEVLLDQVIRNELVWSSRRKEELEEQAARDAAEAAREDKLPAARLAASKERESTAGVDVDGNEAETALVAAEPMSTPASP